MKFMRSREPSGEADHDPMASVANLFDIALVFIVALLFALMARFGQDILRKPSAKVDDAGKMEILTKQGKKIRHLKQSNEKAEGRGVRLGTAYRLEDGTVVYVPENE